MDLLKKTYAEKKGENAVGVAWHEVSVDVLVAACRGLGASALCDLIRLLAQDYKHHSKGLPDLFLWKSNGDSYEIMLIEVKGQNDRLSDNQKVWLEFFANAGIDAKVCHVGFKDTGVIPAVSSPEAPVRTRGNVAICLPDLEREVITIIDDD